jgi:hypothetical protein
LNLRVQYLFAHFYHKSEAVSSLDGRDLALCSLNMSTFRLTIILKHALSFEIHKLDMILESQI